MVDDLSQITIEKLDKKISKCENLGYEFLDGERLLGIHNW